MGKIHQIGDEYYVEFYARGLLYQQKAGKDLKQAEELLRSIEDKIAKGEVLTIARDIELDVFFAEFLKNSRTLYHPATVRRLESTVDNFSQYIRHHYPQVDRLTKVTPRVVEDYKAYGIKRRKDITSRWNPKVINLTLLLLREILEYGIKTGFINDNPTLHVRLLEIDAPVSNILNDEQSEDLLKHVHESFQNMFRFMRFTGLRPTELLDLTWQKVDLNRQVIFVRLREVPLMAQAKNILEKFFASVIDHKAQVFLGPGGGSVDIQTLYEAFSIAREVSGLPASVTAIVFRRMFIIDLVQKRVSLLAIGKMAGIADIAKLMRYAGFFSNREPEML
jgi:site-specific recombinase XerD